MARVADGPDTSVIAGKLHRLGLERYRQYLKTAHWQELRKRLLVGQKCGCGKKATELHHRTYARLGHELDADLEAVCHRCHHERHSRRRRKRRRRPKEAPGDDVMRNAVRLPANRNTLLEAELRRKLRRLDERERRRAQERTA